MLTPGPERDLARDRALLAAELATVSFTEAQAALLCDALHGMLVTPGVRVLVWDEVRAAIAADALAEKWQLAGPDALPHEHCEAGERLVGRLRVLSPGQTLAVVDAVERFWAQPDPLGERVRAVGLVHD